MRRIFRWCHVSCQKTQRLLFRRRVTKSSDAPHRKFRCLRRKRDNGYKWLVRLGGLYKGLTPAIFKLLEIRNTPYTLKNISKPSKCKLITSQERLGGRETILSIECFNNVE